jgi:hypothetical protein
MPSFLFSIFVVFLFLHYLKHLKHDSSSTLLERQIDSFSSFIHHGDKINTINDIRDHQIAGLCLSLGSICATCRSRHHIQCAATNHGIRPNGFYSARHLIAPLAPFFPSGPEPTSGSSSLSSWNHRLLFTYNTLSGSPSPAPQPRERSEQKNLDRAAIAP